ncbi:ketose-bisphosphate aldolase [Parapedobacter sp. 2B3]|uniref:class II fructose-bisphosphate aldolase n=1 Tax=Parapedobacter sp. 2B3 TaxID=3342381 RepID=UPI0035B5E339
MMISPRILFNECYGNYAVPAINVFTLEQVLGVFRAADTSRAPVIIQTTPVARDYATPMVLTAMVEAAARAYPNVVFALHLDHGNERHIAHAIDSGQYSSVMIDASHDALERNIGRTREMVSMAHRKGVFVEAELGVLSGVEDDLRIAESASKYTQPEDAAYFVQSTGCDSLAVAVGTSHGAYKFSGEQGIRFDILRAIQQRLPRFPLVLHGGSSVDPQELARINEAGGQMQQGARGVSDEELRRSTGFGICKVNIATDLRVLWTRVHREFFTAHPEQFDPLVPGRAYVEALEKLCVEKFEKLGAAGKAGAFLA